MIQINQFLVKGMHCQSCVNLITKNLQKEEGIKSILIDLAAENAAISFDGQLINADLITQKIKQLGFEVELQT